MLGRDEPLATFKQGKQSEGPFGARLVIRRHVTEARCSTKRGWLSEWNCRGVFGRIADHRSHEPDGVTEIRMAEATPGGIGEQQGSHGVVK